MDRTSEMPDLPIAEQSPFRKVVRPRGDRRPLYVLVYMQLLENIRSGQLPPGSALPPENQLAKMLGVSRATLRQALLVLKEDGLIINRHGSGTYVRHVTPRRGFGLESLVSVSQMLGEDGVEVVHLKLTFESPDSLVKEILKLQNHELLVVLERVYAKNGERLAYAITFAPNTRLVEPVELHSAERVLDYVDGGLIAHSALSVTRLKATVAGDFLAKCLWVPEGESLLLLEDCLIGDDDVPLAFTKTYLRTNMAEFVLHRGKAYVGGALDESSARHRSRHR